jgi:hypothetical protein
MGQHLKFQPEAFFFDYFEFRPVLMWHRRRKFPGFETYYNIGIIRLTVRRGRIVKMGTALSAPASHLY